MSALITANAATSIGHAIARDWAGRHYTADDVVTGARIAARGKVVIAARPVFGKKVSR